MWIVHDLLPVTHHGRDCISNTIVNIVYHLMLEARIVCIYGIRIRDIFEAWADEALAGCGTPPVPTGHPRQTSDASETTVGCESPTRSTCSSGLRYRLGGCLVVKHVLTCVCVCMDVTVCT